MLAPSLSAHAVPAAGLAKTEKVQTTAPSLTEKVWHCRYGCGGYRPYWGGYYRPYYSGYYRPYWGGYYGGYYGRGCGSSYWGHRYYYGW